MDSPPAVASPCRLRRAAASGAMVAGLLLMGGAIAGIYVRALDAPFIFDDVVLIEQNQSMRQLWPLIGIDGQAAPLTPDAGTPVSGRPIVNLSFALNYAIGQLTPRSYRVVNVVGHFWCALLVWSIVRRTLLQNYFQDRFAGTAGVLAFAVALLWAVHPVNTETVNYLTQRTELMMAFFYLATMYACLRYWPARRSSERGAWLALATICCTLGMLSKEMMASAPAVVLLYERTFVAGSFAKALRRSWPLYLCLACTWLPLLALNFHGPRTPLAGFGAGIDALSYWYTECKVLFLYARLAVWPWPLAIYYEVPLLHGMAQAWPWVSAAAAGALVACWLLWKRPAIGCALVSVVAVLSPTLVVPCVGELAAERRLYLPLVAILALGVVGLYVAVQALARRTTTASRLRWVTLAVVAGMVLLVSGVFLKSAAARSQLYNDELALWLDALPAQPDSPLIHTSIGVLLATRGHEAQAIDYFRAALALDPTSCKAHFNLGRALEDAMRPREAIHHYRKALQSEPEHAASHTHLAHLLAYFGKTDEAVAHYRRALASNPQFAPAHNNLGVLLVQTGAPEEAIVHLQKALAARKSVEGYTNLANAYAMTRRTAEAIAAAEQGASMARAEGDDGLADQIDVAIDHLRKQENAP